MGGPIVIMVMERKARESIGYKTHYVISRQRILLGTGVT